MKRVDLLHYFQLAQALANAKRMLSATSTKVGNIYFGALPLVEPLKNFIASNDGFSATKHVAASLLTAIESFERIHLNDAEGNLNYEKLDSDLASWQWSTLQTEVDGFHAVFTAECQNLEMYSVGQIGIYNMNSLVSKGSERFPAEYRAFIPSEAMVEFDHAGRCLAFNLPTACGFHSIRGLELCILAYLAKRTSNVEKLKSWNDYFNLIEKLTNDLSGLHKPSAKIGPMIQRMKDLERNPLMHPRDTLDIAGADQLFNLASITAIELAKDDLALHAALMAEPANQAGENKLQATAAA